MSFHGENRGGSEIDPGSVLSFLRILLCMSAGITAIAVLGLIFTLYIGQDSIAYQMTLAVNGILLTGGGICYYIMKRKFEALAEKKQSISQV